MTSLKSLEHVGLRCEKVMAWAETKVTSSFVARPTSVEACARIVECAHEQGLTICPRGGGYSYADMILNHGHIILDTSSMDKIIEWNQETGEMTVQPGVTFRQILQLVLGSCWTIPACAGDAGVTIGGAISNNVHGKDSWKLGNFGDHVTELKLLTSSGELLRVNRMADPELFRSLVSGMGLLGIIVQATLRLQRIPSPFVEVVTTPVRDLSESLETLQSAQESADFIIAWVDAFATGKRIGRGTVETAKWIETPRNVGKNAIDDSLVASQRIFGLLPAIPTWTVARPLFRPMMIRSANAAKYRWNLSQGQKRKQMLFPAFNYMLANRIPGWKQLYRPHGYVEFEPLVPCEAVEEASVEILEMCQTRGFQSLLCAIKYHPEDEYFLSYSGHGYSIGIDIALRGRSRQSVTEFARTLYSYVNSLGGKAFLAKDEMLDRDLFQCMYPSYTRFLQVKERIDPHKVFASDLYRRLLA